MVKQINALAKQRIPFLFIIDFDLLKPIIIPLNEIKQHDIYFSLPGYYHLPEANTLNKELVFSKEPVTFTEYETAFEICRKHFVKGHSYLTNLTFPTPINTNLTLLEIFQHSRAKYRLYYKGQFVVFSPETFITIYDHKIASYPMKGTIDADLPNARDVILANEKEFAEHITIVDLIRNDLGIVSTNVQVEKFRFIDEIKTNQKNLLQVSSKITGCLEKDFHSRLGDILYALLPAGSITGAPKKKTVEIIKEAENYDRGYYTGIFGVFDGYHLESAVMIRFIENQSGQLFFKSGGGLTIYSDLASEYQEYIDKVYVPIIGNHKN
ncbi:MAG: aminodeoxychorismate synthase component I [Spirochaetes bacterium]|nr:aminodeoxychorismate synthase component I [Spirochaetota bacterium]